MFRTHQMAMAKTKKPKVYDSMCYFVALLIYSDKFEIEKTYFPICDLNKVVIRLYHIFFPYSNIFEYFELILLIYKIKYWGLPF